MAVVPSSPRACYHPEWPERDAAWMILAVPLTHKDRQKPDMDAGQKYRTPKNESKLAHITSILLIGSFCIPNLMFNFQCKLFPTSWQLKGSTFPRHLFKQGPQFCNLFWVDTSASLKAQTSAVHGKQINKTKPIKPSTVGWLLVQYIMYRIDTKGCQRLSILQLLYTLMWSEQGTSATMGDTSGEVSMASSEGSCAENMTTSIRCPRSNLSSFFKNGARQACFKIITKQQNIHVEAASGRQDCKFLQLGV